VCVCVCVCVKERECVGEGVCAAAGVMDMLEDCENDI